MWDRMIDYIKDLWKGYHGRVPVTRFLFTLLGGILTTVLLSIAVIILSTCLMCFSCGNTDWLMAPLGVVSSIVVIVPILAGIIVGTIYAVASQAQIDRIKNKEKREADLKQRQEYASKFQKEYNAIGKQCENNKKAIEETELKVKYEAMDLQKRLWDVLDDVSISIQVADDKINENVEGCDDGVNRTLNEYRNKCSEIQKQSQDDITNLEEVEKKLHELTIDYKIISGEFVHSIDAIHKKVMNVGNMNDNCSLEEKNSWIEQLQICLSQSMQELNDSKKKLEHFIETEKYSDLIEKQCFFVSKVEKNISEINSLREEVLSLGRK